MRSEYDPDTGRLISHTDALGNTIEFQHDLNLKQEILFDRNGNPQILEYDERGNVVRETDQLGNVVLRRFDARNNVTCQTEAHAPANSTNDCETSPNATLLSYDARDNLLSEMDPEGNTTTFTYNARNQVVTTTDPRLKTTKNVYDSRGNLIARVDAAGTETTFTYDGRGQRTSESVLVGGENLVTTFEYDGSGNLVMKTDPEGKETVFTHDANGNPLTRNRTRSLPGGGIQTLVSEFTHDKLGRLMMTVEPDGSVTRTVYDSLSREKEISDKRGHKTVLDYDTMGRLIRVTYHDDTTEEHTYDPDGRRIASKDRDNRTTSHEYDNVGRLVRTVFPDNSFVRNVYDASGRLVEAVEARGKVTQFEYDRAGRRTKTTDPLGNVTEMSYDAKGNQAAVKIPSGDITEFEYDDLNRRTKTIFPDQSFVEAEFDEIGRRTRQIDQRGIVTSFEYDKIGRLVKVIQDVGALELETMFAYDEVGNRISHTDANGHTTSFEYDELGRETKRTLPDGSVETKAYDAAGNLEALTRFDGPIIIFEYDVNNRLQTRHVPNTSPVRFTYTGTGKRKTAVDGRGTTVYAYDLRDRLSTLIYPDGRRLDNVYDGNGNRTSLKATVGATVLETTFTYDDAGRLDVVTDPNSGQYDHEYDADGNRTVLAHPNGMLTTYQYDTLNRLTELATAGPSGPVQAYQFTLGPAGRRTRIDESGGTFRTYEYDSLYRLTTETVNDTAAEVYQKVVEYDAVGNRMRQTTTGQGAAVVDYTYDTRDRLLAENGVSYGYDATGNRLSKSGEATYVWDLEDRLIRVELGDGTIVTHVYDVDGNRVRTESTPPGGPTAVTDFLVDTTRSLSHVVAESDATGDLLAYYVRGDDLLSVIRTGEQRYYHADGLGSIRFLADESGAVTDSYEYTAFGELLVHSGSDLQPYRFAGEPYDPNSGFYYNRARWLDPSQGRFVSMDPFSGVDSDPPSLHKYAYAANDPVDNVDPTGQFSLATQVTVGFVIGSLASIGLASFQTYMFTSRMPLNPFSEAPKGFVLGYQVSGSPSELIAKYTKNPVLAGVALGLYFLSAGMGLELLVPFSDPTTGWLFHFYGVAVGIGNSPKPKAELQGYGGFFFRATEPSEYFGVSFCKSLGAANVLGGRQASACVGMDSPFAYSATATVGGSSGPTLQSSSSVYYRAGTIPLPVVVRPGEDAAAVDRSWEGLAKFLFGVTP